MVLYGCGSFFCTDLFRTCQTGRRSSEEGLAPGIASTKTTNWLLRAGLNGRGRRNLNRWLGQARHARSPEDAHEVGRWRGTIAGPFPSAPSRTGQARFRASGSPVAGSDMPGIRKGLCISQPFSCHALHLPPVILRPVRWLSQVPWCGVTHTTTTITLFP